MAHPEMVTLEETHGKRYDGNYDDTHAISVLSVGGALRIKV